MCGARIEQLVHIDTLNAFGVLSYLLGALSFLVVAGLMLASWRGHIRGIALIVAAGFTGLWAAALALHGAGMHISLVGLYLGEVVQDLCWIVALASVAGARAHRAVKLVSIFIGVSAVAAAPLSWLLEVFEVFYVNGTALLSRAQLICSMAGLVLVEQLYRNSTHSGRQSIKYFAIGVVAIFAYDLFLYSQAELSRAVSLEAWNARGLVLAFTVPLMALSARRTPDWSLDVFVSRQAVFYASTFLVVGAYLLVTSIGGIYVREFGGEWGRIGQLVFFAGAGVALAGFLASGTLRRHAAVFINKHFYRNKYDYRIEWLRFVQTLSSTEDGEVKRTAARAIAQIFASPGAVLFLREESGEFIPAAAWPMHLDDLPYLAKVSGNEDLPAFLRKTHWIIDLEELRVAPDTYSNIEVPLWLLDAADLRVVAPLLQVDELTGFICLYQPPPPFELTYEDRDLLKTVGRHVATYIAQEDASRKLAESRQFEAYNRLTAFMMHDLKNSIAQLKLVVENSARHKHNPEFIDDSIATISNAVDRMSRLIEQLRGSNRVERAETVDLAALAHAAVARCRARGPEPQIRAESGSWVRANPERMIAVIEHIIRNAQDATGEEGRVVVEVAAHADAAELSVNDSGCGMDPDFVRDRLFRPFDSTKGAKGMGIGAYQAREYIRSLGGSVEVRSTPGIGTSFSFRLPRVVGPRGSEERSAATVLIE